MSSRNRRGVPLADLRRFLKAMDAALDERVPILIIGGSAAALGYEVDAVTQDIDTWGSDVRIQAAAAHARSATGLDIPVHAVPLWDR